MTSGLSPGPRGRLESFGQVTPFWSRAISRSEDLTCTGRRPGNAVQNEMPVAVTVRCGLADPRAYVLIYGVVVEGIAAYRVCTANSDRATNTIAGRTKQRKTHIINYAANPEIAKAEQTTQDTVGTHAQPNLCSPVSRS